MSLWQNFLGWNMRWLNPSGVGQFKPLLHQINALEARFQKQSDKDLAANTEKFRERFAQGETLEDLLPEAFALVREVSWRQLKMRHYDVQILGGLALHYGKVAEMKTGEGKTLVATLPTYLNALTGEGVHVVTVNDYLAQRDAKWMGKIHEFLGLSVGVILEDMGKDEAEETQLRQEAYQADITYATNSALVFDYLRDNLANDVKELVQRGQPFAIVDEVDLLLIDEVRTPLIISGPSKEDSGAFARVDRIIRKLQEKEHYKVEWRTRTASLTEEGWQAIEKGLACGPLNHPDNLKLFHAVYQSVLAHGVYKKDVDYIVKGGEVQLIDEHTGRASPDKRFSDGLHQALEAKERLRVKPEDKTFARTSYQSYFRQYHKLAGMTGTAATEKDEFRKTYGMGVIPIPTHRPGIRRDFVDLVYLHRKDKHHAIAGIIETLQKQGRPVLVGTVSVEESEQLARLLKKRKIRCHVLNAKHHAKEADIIAQAGRFEAVTISTNMAGRGTDILLGGDPEKLAMQRVKGGRRANKKDFEKALQEAQKTCANEYEAVVAVGGLHVIGTSFHEAERLDNQLRGRAGRQGDPGSSQFMCSLDDNIFHHYGEAEMEALQDQYSAIPEGEAIPDKAVLHQLHALRKKVTMDHTSERNETFKYDLVMEEQRHLIYQWRQELLAASEDLQRAQQQAEKLLEDTVRDIITLAFAVDPDEEQQLHVEDHLDTLEDALTNLFAEEFELPETLQHGLDPVTKLMPLIVPVVQAKRQHRLEQYGQEALLAVERKLLLETIDQLWIEHLTNIEVLEDQLQLMGYAEMDPYILFRKAVAPMFSRMLQDIRRHTISLWFAVDLQPAAPTSTSSNPKSRRRHQRK